MQPPVLSTTRTQFRTTVGGDNFTMYFGHDPGTCHLRLLIKFEQNSVGVQIDSEGLEIHIPHKLEREFLEVIEGAYYEKTTFLNGMQAMIDNQGDEQKEAAKEPDGSEGYSIYATDGSDDEPPDGAHYPTDLF